MSTDWEIKPDRMVRTFVFSDFPAAISFMVQAGFVAEKMNHHPEWSNVYGTVEVVLTTHDADGLTQNDLDLARKMDALARG